MKTNQSGSKALALQAQFGTRAKSPEYQAAVDECTKLVNSGKINSPEYDKAAKRCLAFGNEFAAETRRLVSEALKS